MNNQLELPGVPFPPCETGDLGHPWPTPTAVKEVLYGDDWVWMCQECLNIAFEGR